MPTEPLPSFMFCAREPDFADEYVIFLGHSGIKTRGPLIHHIVTDEKQASGLRFDLVWGHKPPPDDNARLQLELLKWYDNWLEFAANQPIPED